MLTFDYVFDYVAKNGEIIVDPLSGTHAVCLRHISVMKHISTMPILSAPNMYWSKAWLDTILAAEAMGGYARLMLVSGTTIFDVIETHSTPGNGKGI